MDITNDYQLSVQDKLARALHAVKVFIIETPPQVVVVGVASLALQIFSTRLAIPSYGFLIGSTLSRIIISIIRNVSPEKALSISDVTIKFHKKLPFIPAIVLLAATILAWFVPIAGGILGTLAGLYYGLVLDLQPIKYQQLIPEHHLGL